MRELEKEIEREGKQREKKKKKERMRYMGIRVWCRKKEKKIKKKETYG